MSEDRWIFRDIGSECINCHEDVHEGLITEKYYPEKQCDICHKTEGWGDVSFTHELTEWALEGSHIVTNCRDCHFVLDENSGNLAQSFNTLEATCQTCHDNVHGDQFEKNGTITCVECHDSQTWFPSRFNHDDTAFPLDGKHVELECNACHRAEKDEYNNVLIKYDIEEFACVDCHS